MPTDNTKTNFNDPSSTTLYDPALPPTMSSPNLPALASGSSPEGGEDATRLSGESLAKERDLPSDSPAALERDGNADCENAPPIPLTTTPSMSLGEPASPPPKLSVPRMFGIAFIVTFTMCMSAAGQQTLNIALPTIQTELGMSESDLQWINSAYSLTNGCFLLLSGRLADVHGRKLVFMVGVGWYAVFSLVGGFMKSGASLAVTRALAGCGAAMSTPSAVGIIAHTFTGKARSTAFASFSAGAPVGGALGLLLGGLFTAYVKDTWRGALFTLAGLAFGIAALAMFIIPTDVPHTNDRRVDWLGAALVTVGLVFIQFAISDGEQAPQGWKTSYVLALLIIGFFLVVAFFFWERHVIHNTTRPPLMRLQLWTRAKGRLAAVYFIGFVTWMGFTSLFYHATLYFQQVQGVGAIGAMLRFIPTSVSGVICNVIVAFLVSRVPTQWIVCVGLLATGIASVLLATAKVDSIYWTHGFNAMWLAVMGADFLMATGLIFVAALSLPDEQSVAGALFQTLIQLGGSFGLAVTSVISDVQRLRALARGLDSVSAQLEGLHAAFWLGAAMSFTALVIAGVALRGMGTIGKGVKRSGGKGKAGEKTEGGEAGVTPGEKVPQEEANEGGRTAVGQEKV
ncbi:hypothetical protein IAT38_000110 [Cryptococcus sp. DSM 104549]